VGQVEGSLHAKTSSIRPVVSTQYRLVADGRTDGQRNDDSIYRASIASRGKNDAVRISKFGGYENKIGKIRDKIFSIS